MIGQSPASGPRAPAVDASPATNGQTLGRAVPENAKRAHWRTMTGTVLTGISTAAATVADNAWGWLNKAQAITGSLHSLSEKLDKWAPFAEHVKTAWPVIVAGAMWLVLYAYFDDRKRRI